MIFFWNSPLLPDRRSLLVDIDLAAQALERRLVNLNLDTLGISQYSRRYLKTYLSELRPVLERISFVLAWSLSGSSDTVVHEPSDLVFLDYGGGTGLMSLLARELGIKRVLYSDYYDVSCRDAQVISRHLGLEAETYLCGEIDDVVDWAKSQMIDVRVVASNDVIEHIYDMGSFIARLPRLSGGDISVALATGANAINPYVSLRLMKLQWMREFKDRRGEPGHKGMDSYRAYRSVRLEMIHELDRDQKLSDADAKMLARATRGKKREDIACALQEFLVDGRPPVRPRHPTNTCDPASSSWAEHLMSPKWITDKMRKAGFNSKVVPGPYGWRRSGTKRTVAAVLDRVIGVMGARGAVLSPYVVYVGTRTLAEVGHQPDLAPRQSAAKTTSAKPVD